jgi:hypothetical protein
MRVRTGGAWRPVTSGRVRVNNAWRTLTRAMVYHDGAWRDGAVFTPPLSLALNSGSAFAFTVPPGTAVTDPITATPTGGLGPFTYSWTRIAGSVGTAATPNSATTTFSQFMGASETVSATFRCTVTDSLGSTATAEVEVTFSAFTFD